MNNRLTIFLLLVSVQFLSGQQSLNVELLGQFHRGDARYSGCWAYIAPNGTEYALLGTRTGTAAYPIDGMIEELGFISGPESNWREITVIDQHAFVTTEGSSDTTGLQIIDLQYLPDSLHLVGTYDSTFTRGHILQRDVYSDEPYIYVNGTSATDGVHILDVSNPVEPVEVGLYAPGYYIHDCFVKGDVLFAAAFFEAKMDIVDISDRTNPVLITEIDHFDGNTHSSWLTEDNRFLIIASELDGKPARIYNVEDYNNIEEVEIYTANFESLVHNPYIRGDWAFISHNTEGLRVLDIHDPELPVEVGYYDTFDGPSGGFFGLWSACPFYPSGKIIGGNREDGLYVWTFNDTKAGRIYANVIDSLTGAPFSNIEVLIQETNDTLETDINGFLSWGALPGTYTFKIEEEGYFTKCFEFTFEGCDSLLLDIPIAEDIPESIWEISNQDIPTFDLYPNPTIGNIKLELARFENSTYLEVYNLKGQFLKQFSINPFSPEEIDLTPLEQGVFQLLLKDKNGAVLGISKVVIN